MTDGIQIAEQLLRILNGGDPSPDSVYKQEECELYVAQAIAALAKMNYFEKLNMDDHSVEGQFIIQVTGLSINTDIGLEVDGTQRKYVDPQQAWVSLPKGRGLQYVRPESAREPTIPISSGQQYLLKANGQLPLQGRLGFYVEGQKIYLIGQWGSPVMVGMVAASVDINQMFNIPQDLEAQIFDYIFTKILRYQGTMDRISDANSTKQPRV